MWLVSVEAWTKYNEFCYFYPYAKITQTMHTYISITSGLSYFEIYCNIKEVHTQIKYLIIMVV